MANNGYWGYEHLVGVKNLNKEKITNPNYLKLWVESLADAIDMVRFGEPNIVHFGDDDYNLSGWTVIQLLITSNITAHFNDNTQDLYLNVFSCKEFDHNIVLNHLKEWFGQDMIVVDSEFKIRDNGNISRQIKAA